MRTGMTERSNEPLDATTSMAAACASSSPPKCQVSPKALADAISSAAAALQIVVLRGKGSGGRSVTLADDAVFRAIVGWPQRELHPGHPAFDKDPMPAAALLEAIRHLILLPNVPLEAHNEALRRWILPKRSASIETLRALHDSAWQSAKELMLAKMLHECAIDADTLLKLADQNRAPARAEFASAFRLKLPRATRWRAPAEENPAKSVLEPRVRAAGGDVHTLNLDEALVVARAQFTNAWCSPLAYFIQNGVNHFGEAYTEEGVRALATYLSRRRVELGGEQPIVEIGAGGGRLAHLLNATGMLSPGVIATDPTPQPSPFKVHKLNDEAAIRTHAPGILLCAWMSIGQDWTPRWRRAKIHEYVLIGALGAKAKRDDPPSYSHSLCFDHSPYTRHLLDEVSAELLPIEAGMESPSAQADPGYSRVCAVAYRRPG